MSTDFLHNEQELLQQTALGDQKAFAALLDFYRNRVFSHAITYVKFYEEAEEIVQDIFVKIWINREKLPEIKDFKNYLFILSRNQIVSAIRKRTQERMVLAASSPYDDLLRPDKQLDLKDIEHTIALGVSRLPPQQKAVFTLSRSNHFSQEEISQLLGISRRTVKFHMAVALNSLREFLNLYTESAGAYCIALVLYNYAA